MVFPPKLKTNDYRMTKKHIFIYSCAILSFWSIVSLIMGNFTKLPVGDEIDYVMRGAGLLANGLEAISDGYRPPLFPFLVAALNLVVPERYLLLGMRILNLVIVVFS